MQQSGQKCIGMAEYLLIKRRGGEKGDNPPLDTPTLTPKFIDSCRILKIEER